MPLSREDSRNYANAALFTQKTRHQINQLTWTSYPFKVHN